ncbi:MAG: class I SAM-dependent DNA methyltransferase [Cyclobacteriaceae bacterium]|tara:strand:+ start:3500 stop:5008 length:1509 start_codon:yes stop_codon:yes gene_type:complete
MITGDLKNKIDNIWDTYYSNGFGEPFSVIQQVTYLIFLKRLDEEQTLKEKKANRLNQPIENPIYTEDQQEIRWSTFKNFDPDKMLEVFTKTTASRPVTAFDFMKNVGGENSEISSYFEKATFGGYSAYLLDKVVQLIDGLNMHDRDTKGDLYEYMLGKLTSAGRMGAFRTPRHIIRMMVQMMEPDPDDTICDPAAGTAGFLVMAEEYLRENHEDEFRKEDFIKHFNNEMFTGLEFDPNMMQIGAMNLILHGIDSPQLMRVNSLGDDNKFKEEFSLILANPPFAAKLDYDQVSANVLSLAKTKDTELLFISLMLRMLKVGGRAAVIIPQGVLFGSNKAYQAVRKELVQNQNLQAVISMPSGVFKPYTGVSTAVLVFTKTNSGGTGHVWFYDMKADGYTLDDKRNEVEQNDISDIIARWKAMAKEAQRERTDQSFLVPVSEIEENHWDLSINRYKEIVYEEVVYDAPDEIINGKTDEEGNKVPGIKELIDQNRKDLEALEALLK